MRTPLMAAMVAALVLAGGMQSQILAQAAPQAKEKAASASAFDGSWQGTFTGDSSGHVSVVLSAKGDTPTGTLKVSPAEGDSYDATFRTLSFDNGVMKAAYDAPGGGGVITLEGKIDGTTLKGVWTTSDGSTGTWTTTRTASSK